MLRDQRLADGKRLAIESDMATPNTNDAVVMDAVSFITPASGSSTWLREMRIGDLAFENTNALMGLLLIAGLGSFFCSHFRLLDVVGLAGVLAVCAFVIVRCSVLIVRKRQVQAFSIVLMALLVIAGALARWYLFSLMQS